MDIKDIEEQLSLLFQKHTGQKTTSITAMPASGSSRRYYRMISGETALIGVYNADRKENDAFVSFTESFHRAEINAPVVLECNLDKGVYLQTDLGDRTLFEQLKTNWDGKAAFPDSLLKTYTTIIEDLIKIQFSVAKEVDYEKCYPRSAFDEQSMLWDLNYFKYYFLKLGGVAFDEQALENDYKTFSSWLLEAQSDYFLYRDFQSRNIMLVDDVPHYIDYQGGRKGALQYDLAALLYDAKAGLPESVREHLLNYYLQQLQQVSKINKQDFIQLYYGFVLIRIMQAMGAYGYRGFFERKAHFLQSIPYALDNMREVYQKVKLPIQLPALEAIWSELPNSNSLRDIGLNAGKLKVTICSFSYKRGLPVDKTEHGGGFIFDCRSIHNPGRYPEYKRKSGLDQEVKDFFAKENEMHEFLEDMYSMVGRAVKKYSDRKFDYLSVSFGCTGGQHRSVYSAEALKVYLEKQYDVVVDISHRETNYWKG